MTILVVDDNEQNLYQLQVLLGGNGYQVVTAANGAEALAKARQAVPHLIISDILMPVMDGFALCREWKNDERLRSVPFVFYTATYTDERDRELALSLGAERFLVKPAEPEVLVSTVREAIEQAKSQRVAPTSVPPAGNADYLQGYNAALIRKLETKMQQLEQANRELEQKLADLKRADEAREKLEAQLLQAQKLEAVGRLAGGVAHDFNNTLQTIMGNAELALDQVPAHHPLRDDIAEIQAAATRSAELTMQLLAFARKQVIAPKTINLNEAIPGMLRMLRRLIGEDIDLCWKPAPDLWPVMMDPSQLNQVLANLAVNARDAIAGVGTLTIETANVQLDTVQCRAYAGGNTGPYVMLSVRDTGCGMDKAVLAQIFEPFFTTKEVGKGTGLGLAMVYGIVQQNHGAIEVTSEPGQGTTFRLYLPQHVPVKESRGAPADTPAAGAATGKETIMVVEDDPALLRSCLRLLQGLGYTVLSATGPGDALRVERAHVGDIHLLLTDVIMPEMSGRQLQDRLAATRPALKCLFMSGYTADVIAPHGVLAPGVHFLQKPFTRDTLAAKLREVLDS